MSVEYVDIDVSEMTIVAVLITIGNWENNLMTVYLLIWLALITIAIGYGCITSVTINDIWYMMCLLYTIVTNRTIK